MVQTGFTWVLFGANGYFELSVRPHKIKNPKKEKQKKWIFEELQTVKMKNDVGNLN